MIWIDEVSALKTASKKLRMHRLERAKQAVMLCKTGFRTEERFRRRSRACRTRHCSTNRRPTVDQQSTNSRPTVDQQSTNRQPTVGSISTNLRSRHAFNRSLTQVPRVEPTAWSHHAIMYLKLCRWIVFDPNICSFIYLIYLFVQT